MYQSPDRRFDPEPAAVAPSSQTAVATLWLGKSSIAAVGVNLLTRLLTQPGVVSAGRGGEHAGTLQIRYDHRMTGAVQILELTRRLGCNAVLMSPTAASARQRVH